LRIRPLALLLLAGAGACLGDRRPATPPDAGVADGAAVRPLTQTITIQAAYDGATFFLHARWLSDAVAPALSVALSDRAPATAVRDFARTGCFLGCHDASNDMPNWRPEDGERSMYLLPGFGGPADVWLWEAAANDPAGRAAVTSMGTDGMNDDPDAGAGGLATVAAFADGAWDVVYVRTQPATPPGRVALLPSARYDLGFALHDDVEGRHHYVSLPVELGLGDPAAALVAVALPAGATPDFSDTLTFPAHAVNLFLPGITSFEFLVGAVVDRAGHLRNGDVRHGGAQPVATGTHACGDCHRVIGDAVVPPVQNAGALERLVLRRGGVVGPPAVEVGP
jgi:hypothetical protein